MYFLIPRCHVACWPPAASFYSLRRRGTADPVPPTLSMWLSQRSLLGWTPCNRVFREPVPTIRFLTVTLSTWSFYPVIPILRRCRWSRTPKRRTSSACRPHTSHPYRKLNSPHHCFHDLPTSAKYQVNAIITSIWRTLLQPWIYPCRVAILRYAVAKVIETVSYDSFPPWIIKLHTSVIQSYKLQRTCQMGLQLLTACVVQVAHVSNIPTNTKVLPFNLGRTAFYH